MAFHNHLGDLLNSTRGLLAAHSLQTVVIEDTLAGCAAECLAECGLSGKVTLVSDIHTHAVLGKRIEQELSALTHVDTLLFQQEFVPDIPHATQVREAAQNSGLIVAVGSGTISDICKYASFLGQKPYVMFPTAPSMNGYVSATASILKMGHKHSLPATLPAGIFCDMEVIAAAPQRLIRSGFGDLMCRSTAQADWLLSHLLLDTPYSTQAFELLKPYEAKLIKKAAELREGDKGAVELLMKALLVSGIGMVLAKGSYPASQGEHLIAHCMEMMLPWDSRNSYHGEQVAVTTLTMAAIQDTFLKYVPSPLKNKSVEADIQNYFSPSLREGIMEEYGEKRLHADALAKGNGRISTQWPDIAKKLKGVRMQTDKLRTLLQAAGCPLTPEEVGWNPLDYEKAVAHAHFIRNRFTFLDVAYLSR